MSDPVVLPKTPSFRLDGRRALVTGAGRGLGMPMAAALAEAGADVVLAARTLSEVEAVAEAIRALTRLVRHRVVELQTRRTPCR